MLSVVKVGGSLFDFPELRQKLIAWIASRGPEERLLFVPGGGNFADAIRSLHRTHQLSETTSHWLAIGTLTITARFLQSIIPQSVITDDFNTLERRGILDVFPILQRDDVLEHSWRVTSDTISAHIARVAKADRLVLLKSIDVTPDSDGVDAAFAETVADASFVIEAINFRTWTPDDSHTN